MKIGVLANGAWDAEWGRLELQGVDFLICADGGANAAIESGRLPDVLIGDLDSVMPENMDKCQAHNVKIMKYPREKDETDLELALAYAHEKAKTLGADSIWLYGATGKRIDHFLGNVAMLLAYAQKGRTIRLVDPLHQMWIIQGKERIKGTQGQGLSLIVLSEKAVVSNEGFYYPLKEEVLYQTSSRGMSNVFLGDEGTIQVHSGWVLVILTMLD